MIQYKSQLPKISLLYEPAPLLYKAKITNSKDIADYVRQFYSDDINIYESCFILLLNKGLQTIGWVKIGQGGVAGAYVDCKIICKYAIESLASSVAIVHNHPSGNLMPSRADIDLTKHLKEMLTICECQLIDHIIITDESYRSMVDEGDFQK